jgi:hypothetical protein
MVKLIHPEVKKLRTEAEKKRLRNRKRRFLKKLAECGQIREACELAGVGCNQVKRWRNHPAFEEKVQQARNEAIEKLETEADRRGCAGYDDPVFYEGAHVGDRTLYSDQLLMMRLKALAPEKYRDRRPDQTVKTEVKLVLPDNGR